MGYAARISIENLHQPALVPDRQQVRELSEAAGLLLSIYVSGHGPGGATPTTARLRALLEQLREDLRNSQLGLAEQNLLLEPLEALLNETALLRGHRESLALFRSEEELRGYWLPRTVPDLAVFDSQYHLLPLLDATQSPAACLLLALTRKHVRLYRCAPGECEALALPAGMPESLESFLGTKAPDHTLRGGITGGSGLRVSFTTLTDREKQRVYFHDYCLAIDRGLSPLLKTLDVPLVVAATHDEFAMFAAARESPFLMPASLELSPDGGFEPGELARRALVAVSHWKPPALERAIERGAALAGSTMCWTDPKVIVHKAQEGRIREVFVRRGWTGETGLVNRAVRETLNGGGDVWMVDAGELPAAAPLLAVVRY